MIFIEMNSTIVRKMHRFVNETLKYHQFIFAFVQNGRHSIIYLWMFNGEKKRILTQGTECELLGNLMFVCFYDANCRTSRHQLTQRVWR